MGRFSPLQFALLAFGCSLILASVFLDHIATAWENYRYPNAVHWHSLRIVPTGSQRIAVPTADVLVVRDKSARLTLFRRADDKLTPEAMVRDLCRRDRCVRSSVAGDDDRAVATYRINGQAMQIVLMRLGGGALWVEYNGAPEALAGFDGLLESVSAQLAEIQARGPG